jgi:predicted  nucleic acid-binding Zn-ribbon protein
MTRRGSFLVLQIMSVMALLTSLLILSANIASGVEELRTVRKEIKSIQDEIKALREEVVAIKKGK